MQYDVENNLIIKFYQRLARNPSVSQYYLYQEGE